MDFSKTIKKIKSFFQTEKRLNIYSPFDGVLYPQNQIPDEVFSESHIGIGVGIKANQPDVVSPISGVLSVMFDKTKHAYTIKDEQSGVSVFLHIGIDTVKIDPAKSAFVSELKQSDHLSLGQIICHMNLDLIKEEAKSDISAFLVSNENIEGKKVVIHNNTGEVKKGDLIMSVVY